MPECLHRPGMLESNIGNYPWLADSWPATNLVHSDKEAVNCCSANHETAERYYNGGNVSWVCCCLHELKSNQSSFVKSNLCSLTEAGISNYLSQTEKYSTGGSTEGPIYSTIDATNEDLHGLTYSQNTSTSLYATTTIMPFVSQTQVPAHSGERQDDEHWISPPDLTGAQYAQPDRCSGKT